MAVFTDLRPLLPAIQASTLVLYRRNDKFAGPPHARYQHIANAKLVELPGEDNLIYAGDSDKDLDRIEEFLTGAVPAPRSNRVLATVLFTDIVSSAEHLAELGDRKWHDLLDSPPNSTSSRNSRPRSGSAPFASRSNGPRPSRWNAATPTRANSRNNY
jgi:hypothetical protein